MKNIVTVIEMVGDCGSDLKASIKSSGDNGDYTILECSGNQFDGATFEKTENGFILKFNGNFERQEFKQLVAEL